MPCQGVQSAGSSSCPKGIEDEGLSLQSTGATTRSRVSFDQHIAVIGDSALQENRSMSRSTQVSERNFTYYEDREESKTLYLSVCFFIILIGYILLLRYKTKDMLSVVWDRLPFEGGI